MRENVQEDGKSYRTVNIALFSYNGKRTTKKIISNNNNNNNNKQIITFIY